ncbi:hypothetical protein PY546_02795 [Providencia stuartii]|nr:hypothetical protein [Providencia stuartii]
MFVGPGTLPAPPWGSVYLDAEGLLQGGFDSCAERFSKTGTAKTKYPVSGTRRSHRADFVSGGGTGI